MTARFSCLLVACLLIPVLVAGSVQAVEPDEILADPVLEARARAISAQLRCLVCQNQSIDDSDAPLAKDLRVLVRERVVSGDSDDEVKAFMVERYGAFVLLKPPLDPSTYILWFAPFVLAAGIALIIIAQLRKRRHAPAHGLTAEEERELSRILQDGE